jgi:lysophospholipase L1-like esterase
MVTMLKASRRPCQEMILLTSRRPLVTKSLFLLVCAALIWLWNEEQNDARFRQETSDLHHMLLDNAQAQQPNPMNRCIDSDDARRLAKTCRCSDPLVSTARATWDWAAYHRRMVAAAAAAAKQHDVVFLGDSITEHWNGTKQMGTIQLPAEYRAVFEQTFGEGGLALGSAGDTTTELLWHLQHGILDEKSLQPRVFVLLIGTNDLGRGCSKRTVLAAILNLAHYLHTQRPDAIIILHGLLPRAGSFGEKPGDRQSLGLYWQDIDWINGELKRFCSLHPGEWFYLDTSAIFLSERKRRPGEDQQELKMINKELITDGLHPNVKGREKWAPLILKEIQTRIQEREKERQKQLQESEKREKEKRKKLNVTNHN